LIGSKISNTTGFSLVELMIVILMIGILAAIGIPMYYDNVYQAKRAEALAIMGSIRSEIDWYFVENGSYPVADKDEYVIGADWNNIRSGELKGKYFSDSSFYYKSRDGSSWELKVKKKESWLEQDLKLNSNGDISGAD